MAPGIIKIIYGVSKWTQDESGRGVGAKGGVGSVGKWERGEGGGRDKKGSYCPLAECSRTRGGGERRRRGKVEREKDNGKYEGRRRGENAR